MDRAAHVEDGGAPFGTWPGGWVQRYDTLQVLVTYFSRPMKESQGIFAGRIGYTERITPGRFLPVLEDRSLL